MKMKINSLGSDAIQIQIDGEDYSVADIIHKELLNVKNVKFAGVAPPHPLIKTLTIQVHTDGGESEKLLKQAVENAQEKVKEILDAAKKAFPDALQPLPVRQTSKQEKPVQDEEKVQEPVSSPRDVNPPTPS